MVIYSLEESADYIRNIKSFPDVLCVCLLAVAQRTQALKFISFNL